MVSACTIIPAGIIVLQPLPLCLNRMSAKTKNGHQVRAEDTKARLLAAAEEVFIREGFEKAQLATIAKAAGRTKGSIYGHYESKDDLFVALYEHRNRREMDRLLEAITDCRTREEAVQRLKAFLLDLIADRTWPLLTLEFKLYSVRHPESRERLAQAYSMTKLVGQDLFQRRFYGRLGRAERMRLETAAAAIGPILSAMTLETYFEPELLSEKRLLELLSQLFDVLLSPGNQNGSHQTIGLPDVCTSEELV
jgi:AcrR family transcriptional regulator